MEHLLEGNPNQSNIKVYLGSFEVLKLKNYKGNIFYLKSKTTSIVTILKRKCSLGFLGDMYTSCCLETLRGEYTCLRLTGNGDKEGASSLKKRKKKTKTLT